MGKKRLSKYWDKPLKWVEGCTPVSAGCVHCWSAGQDARFHTRKLPYHPGGMSEAGELVNKASWWNGKEHINTCAFNGRILCRPDRLSIPSRTRKPTVFSVWNDLFHEDVPESFISDALLKMRENGRHHYLVLTKRAERMADMLSRIQPGGYYPRKYPSSIWFGTSAENQAALDERLPHLLRVPGNRFLSLEPLLGPIDGEKYLVSCEGCGNQGSDNYMVDYDKQLCRACPKGRESPSIHWVVVGAETGPHKRPCDPAWINDIVRQCKEANVPVWVKTAPPGAEVVRQLPWERNQMPEIHGG